MLEWSLRWECLLQICKWSKEESNVDGMLQATGSLISHIKGEAQIQEDTDHHQRLMGAAKKLADATTKMIEAAKSCASSPMDFDNQMHLKSAAEEVRVATSAAGQDQLRRAAILKLEVRSALN